MTKPKTASLVRQIDELQRMSARELRKKWKDLFGSDPGQLGSQYLIRRLAYRIQELVYGGLSREARGQLKELAQDNNCKTKTSQVTNLQVGTRLVREWHGQKYETIVQENGYSVWRQRPIAVSARWPGRSPVAIVEAGGSLGSSRVRSGGNASECTKEECPLCDLHPEKS